MPKKTFVVIGGGIVGLAVAERLARRGEAVTVLEKEPRWAAHQTGHNSGVIHAGPYYKPGSLKARMCTAGNRSMSAFAAEHGIAHDICGKLIVAVKPEETVGLEKLHERALANGVPVRMLGADEIREFEPHVAAIAGMRVESTGIIDYEHVSRTLASLAASFGAKMHLNTTVTGIRTIGDQVTVETTVGTHRADVLVNCAGLHSDKIARMAGITPRARIIPFRGEYFELAENRRGLVHGLIYPVPDPTLPFLGVHLTRMIDGSVHAGPNAVTALAREGYSWKSIDLREALGDLSYPGFLRMASRNMGVGVAEVLRSLSRKRFAASLARLVPEITAQDLVPAEAGVRAQAILRNGALVDDFLIERVPGQVHVLNAPSPAATSALEIAKSIVDSL